MLPQTVIVDSDYAVLVERGSNVVQRMERDRYYLGGLAQLVTRHYGEKSLQTYAADISMKYSTLAEYKQVSIFIENSAARKFVDRELYPTLNYTAMRLATRICNRDSLPAAIEFLELCASNSLTPEQAEHAAGKDDDTDKPEKVAEFEYEIRAEDFPFLVTPLPENVHPGRTYLITLYEVKQPLENKS